MEKMDAVEIAEVARDHLRALGLDAEWKPSVGSADGSQDGDMSLTWRGRSHVFTTSIRRSLRASPNLLARIARGGPGNLVIADSISGQQAQLLRDLGLNYVDAAGNVRIASPDFLIDVQGRRRPVPRPKEPRGFTKTDLRVVLALIARPDVLGASARELGELVGVSHGGAHNAVTQLTQKGFLTRRGLRHGAKLADEWTQAYLLRGGAHKSSRTLFVDADVDVIGRLDGLREIQFSGESAAESLGWPIRSHSFVIYAPEYATVAKGLRGRSDGGDVAVEIRTPVLAPSDNADQLAASLLIRADMLASNDSRQIEIAHKEFRHDPNLRRLWEIA